MTDRLSQAVHETPGGDGHDPRPDAAVNTSSSSKDVLGILEDIESQFERLRTIRGDQVDSLRELKERSTRLEAQKSELASDKEQFAQMQAGWNDQVKQERLQFEDSKQCLDADRRSHDRRVEEDKDTLARDRKSLNQDRERIRDDQESQRQTLKTLETELTTRSETLVNDQAILDDQRSRLDGEVEQSRLEHDRLVSALVVARRLLEKRGRLLRRQESRLDRYRTSGIKWRSRRRGLESCIRSQRRTIDTLEKAHDDQSNGLNEARRRLQGFMEQLREQGDLVERGNAALALVDSLEGRIETLQTTIEQNRTTFDAQREASVSAIEQERDALLERIEKQENIFQELQASEEHAPEQQDVDDLADQKGRLADIACHLHRRRERLRFLRGEIGRRGDPSTQMDTHEARSQQLRKSEVIEKRQLELDEVSRILGDSERRMIRKWAAPQSVVVSCWILLGISILAAASWLAADRITPAIRSTSITLVPQLQSDEQMGEEALVNWKAMHEKQIRSDGFIRDVAQRSAARRLHPWTTFESVQRLMTDDLSIDAGQPGQITMTLASDQPDKASDFMEIVASAMVVDSQRSLASRPGGHGSRLVDGRTENGVLRHARLNPTVVRDERMVTAGVVLAGGLIMVSMLLGIVYSRLLRAKRVFELEHSSTMDNRSIRPI